MIPVDIWFNAYMFVLVVIFYEEIYVTLLVNTKGVRFECCSTRIHLCGTLALHTHIITLFHVRTLDEEKVEEKVRGGQG